MITEHLYYRGEDRIDADIKARIEKVFGCDEVGKPYNYFKTLPMFFDSGSCFHKVNELSLYIQTTKNLNERDQALVARIAKGLTLSTAYYSNYVEENLLHKLYSDAVVQYNKEFEDKIEYLNGGEIRELRTIYNIPVNKREWLVELEKAEDYIKHIQEPVKIYDIKHHDFQLEATSDKKTVWDWNSQTSGFKMYYIDTVDKYNWNLKDKVKRLYTELPYVRKVYLSTVLTNSHYLQVYVYDNAASDRALQNVVHWLVENNCITLP